MAGRPSTAALAVVAVVLVTGSLFGCSEDLPPRTVQDTGFIRAANAACAKALPPLREARPKRGEGSRDRVVIARQVDRAAERLKVLADDLRDLPVAAADRAEVEGWLDTWDAYVAVGHRFATALRDEGEKTAASVSAEDDELSRRIALFAQANDMPECVF
ncbi:MAG TPA: hypothetical protein VHE80_11130 [Acidimicrobiales bacterium]|nr:hypothetical protein [Acidimicrobiales bacterium]